MAGKKSNQDTEAPAVAPVSTTTPDAQALVAEKSAPDPSPAPTGKQPPRERRVAPPPEN